ncbi:MAG: imidazolonepropionase [Candidatus Scatomorpha sp.]
MQALLPEIMAMLADGKTQREVAEHFGFKDKHVVKGLLKRQRKQQRMLEMGLVPRPKGRPRKDAAQGDMAYEIKRLQMENKLLRDFLQSTGRR